MHSSSRSPPRARLYWAVTSQACLRWRLARSGIYLSTPLALAMFGHDPVRRMVGAWRVRLARGCKHLFVFLAFVLAKHLHSSICEAECKACVGLPR